MSKPVEKYYDHLSSKYDEITSNSGVWITPQIMAQQVALLIKDGDRLLDIGVGTGQLIKWLKQTGISLDLEGVEISKKMRDICAKKYPDLTIYQEDFSIIEFQKGKSFEVITMGGVLEFIPDLTTLLSKCFGLLSPGGHFVFTYEPVILGHKIQEYAKSLTQSSLDDPRFNIEDFFTYRYPPFKVYQQLIKNGLEIKLDQEFIAYKKKDIDIIYHLVVAQKFD